MWSKRAAATQEQAVAAWITNINQIRMDELGAALRAQATNLENALTEVGKLKDFVGNPDRILGSPLSKHGEIAEHVQVRISNARKLVAGLKAEYTFDGVGRTAPEDYLKNGQWVQSKYYNSTGRTLDAVKEHLEKYPFFVKEGGCYDIPRDYYARIEEILKKPVSQLRKEEYTIFCKLKDLEEKGIRFGKELNGGIAAYADVQQGKINETISVQEKKIFKIDKEKKQQAYSAAKASWKEGGRASLVSAGLEGGTAFCLAMAKKRKSGKKLSEFDAKDWNEIGIDTGIGTVKGGIRGATVYALSNFTATSANVASALVTAAYGVCAQADAYRKKEISEEDFLINSETLCLDVTVSAIAATLGQSLIPVPVLGALIGNVTGMFLYDIAKEYCAKEEQRLIKENQAKHTLLNEQLSDELAELMRDIEKRVKKFSSLIELAFDADINISFAGSAELAAYAGVEEEKILRKKKDIDNFFSK